jgi:hypothetical protein
VYGAAGLREWYRSSTSACSVVRSCGVAIAAA